MKLLSCSLAIKSSFGIVARLASLHEISGVPVPHSVFATKLGITDLHRWLYNGIIYGELVNLTVENTPNSVPDLDGLTVKCSTSRNWVSLRMPSSMTQQSLLYRMSEKGTGHVGKEGINLFLISLVSLLTNEIGLSYQHAVTPSY